MLLQNINEFESSLQEEPVNANKNNNNDKDADYVVILSFIFLEYSLPLNIFQWIKCHLFRSANAPSNVVHHKHWCRRSLRILLQSNDILTIWTHVLVTRTHTKTRINFNKVFLMKFHSSKEMKSSIDQCSIDLNGIANSSYFVNVSSFQLIILFIRIIQCADIFPFPSLPADCCTVTRCTFWTMPFIVINNKLSFFISQLLFRLMWMEKWICVRGNYHTLGTVSFRFHHQTDLLFFSANIVRDT